MPTDRVETAQLQREIVGVAVHDLGSVAAALVMRAALPPASALAQAEHQQAVMASLADQVRAAMHLLDVARFPADAPVQSVNGPASMGPEATSPGVAGPSVSLAAWLHRWPALGQVVLPRGARLRVEGAEAVTGGPYRLPLQTDALATRLLLCGLHALRDARDVTLQAVVHAAGPAAAVLRCTVRTASRVRRPSKWQRYAAHALSTFDDLMLWWEEDTGGGHVLRLTVPLASEPSQESA